MHECGVRKRENENSVLWSGWRSRASTPFNWDSMSGVTETG
ncbi:MAG: hypothetical protein ACRET7_12235 [Burkholderiales bacterium]